MSGDPAISSPAKADVAGLPGAASRTVEASNRALARPMTGASEEPVVFVELNARQDADEAVLLEGEAFRHPFRHTQ
jgi:hypothetical protein